MIKSSSTAFRKSFAEALAAASEDSPSVAAVLVPLMSVPSVLMRENVL